MTTLETKPSVPPRRPLSPGSPLGCRTRRLGGRHAASCPSTEARDGIASRRAAQRQRGRVPGGPAGTARAARARRDRPRSRPGRPQRSARPRAGAAPTCSCSRRRGRVGGRVEQTRLRDGRLVQLGGEVVGPFHTAYRGLVAELGLTLVPSYVAEPGVVQRAARRGRLPRRRPAVADGGRARGPRPRRGAVLRPGAHRRPRRSRGAIPTPARLDATSLDDWLRASARRRPRAARSPSAHLSSRPTGRQRWSLLAELRKQAAAGADGVLRRRRLGERAGRRRAAPRSR